MTDTPDLDDLRELDGPCTFWENGKHVYSWRSSKAPCPIICRCGNPQPPTERVVRHEDLPPAQREGDETPEFLKATLKPCPFCGGEGLPIDGTADTGDLRFFIHCRSCACEGGWGKTATSAVRFWNTRTPVPARQCDGHYMDENGHQSCTHRDKAMREAIRVDAYPLIIEIYKSHLDAATETLRNLDEVQGCGGCESNTENAAAFLARIEGIEPTSPTEVRSCTKGFVECVLQEHHDGRCLTGLGVRDTSPTVDLDELRDDLSKGYRLSTADCVRLFDLIERLTSRIEFLGTRSVVAENTLADAIKTLRSRGCEGVDCKTTGGGGFCSTCAFLARIEGSEV